MARKDMRAREDSTEYHGFLTHIQTGEYRDTRHLSAPQLAWRPRQFHCKTEAIMYVLWMSTSCGVDVSLVLEIQGGSGDQQNTCNGDLLGSLPDQCQWRSRNRPSSRPGTVDVFFFRREMAIPLRKCFRHLRISYKFHTSCWPNFRRHSYRQSHGDQIGSLGGDVASDWRQFVSFFLQLAADYG